MPNVYKERGKYRGDLWHRGKKHTHSTGLTNQRDAQTAFDAWAEAKIKELDVEAVAGTSLQIGDVGSRFMLDKAQYFTDRINYERKVSWLVRYFGAAKLLTAIDTEAVRVMIRVRAKDKVGKGKNARPIKNATVNDSIKQLKELFTFCKPKAHFPDEPDWRNLWLPEVKPHTRELLAEEESGLDRAIEDHRADYWPLIAFINHVAKRKMNCIELEWRQVKWEEGVIEMMGKGRRGVPKRIVFEIDDTIRELLWPLYCKRHDNVGESLAERRVFTYTADHNSDYVTRHRRLDGGVTETRVKRVKGLRYPITNAGFRGVWNTLSKHAGFATRFRIHDFRHDFASKALRTSGADGLMMVSKGLDHSDYATTLRIYGHLLPDATAKLREKLTTARKARLGKKADKNHPQNHPQRRLKTV